MHHPEPTDAPPALAGPLLTVVLGLIASTVFAAPVILAHLR
jgi:hypothetical protein